MAFLIRKPFIFIIIGIVALVLIIQFSGVLTPKPVVAISPSLSSSSISMNKNATLTVAIENKGARLYSVEYRIVGSFNSSQLRFYDDISRTPLSEPVYNSTTKLYTIIYAMTWNLNPSDKRTVSVQVKGLDPKTTSATYTITLQVWADKALSDKRDISLTVTRT